jgi:hypothetical protein
MTPTAPIGAIAADRQFSSSADLGSAYVCTRTVTPLRVR